MDRIEALLAEAQEKANQSKAENGLNGHQDALAEVMEGPAMPPKRGSSQHSPGSPRSPSPGRSPRRRGRGRSPVRNYDRDDDRSPYGSPPRKRSKMRSPVRWERSPDRYSPRHHGRDRRDDYHSSRYGRSRYGRGRSPSPIRRKSEERAERDQKYNVLKEEREVRTIFVQNLPLDISEREVEDFFESHDCPVRDVQLVVDKQRKFKGLAYVEFYQKESVPAAFLLNGESLLGRPLLIESSNSQKNQSSSSYGSSEGGSYHQGDSGRSSHSGLYLRLYIGNLDYGITQDMLRELLQQFGPIESVRLQTEPNGRSKGHAFVQYYQKDHALAAFHQLNSTPLAGRPLRCDFTKDARARDPDLPPSPPMISGRTTYFPASGSAVAAAGPQQASQAPAGEMGSLDDDVKVSNTSMHNLIQRLAASGTSASGAITAANVIAHPPPQQASAAIPLLPHIDKSTLPNPGTPSTCVCLKNLFDPSLETNPNFDKEIELDVAEEAKFYGPFNHIFVDKNSFGDVYLRFEQVSAAEKAVEVMHGRFFATRLVRAEYIPSDVYATKFSL